MCDCRHCMFQILLSGLCSLRLCCWYMAVRWRMINNILRRRDVCSFNIHGAFSLDSSLGPLSHYIIIMSYESRTHACPSEMYDICTCISQTGGRLVWIRHWEYLGSTWYFKHLCLIISQILFQPFPFPHMDIVRTIPDTVIHIPCNTFHTLSKTVVHYVHISMYIILDTRSVRDCVEVRTVCLIQVRVMW